MNDLEEKYQAPLAELVNKVEITHSEMKQLVEVHHLMPDDFIDSVNAWADEELGRFSHRR